MDYSPPGSWDSPGKNAEMGYHALLQGIFPTQGSNLSLLSRLHWQEGSLPPVLPGKPSVFVIDTHKGTALLWSNNPRNSDQ